MEILERAKNGCELVPLDVSEKDMRDEVNRRTAKAGLTTRNGESVNATKIQNRGYGESKLNVWPRDENGQLIGD